MKMIVIEAINNKELIMMGIAILVMKEVVAAAAAAVVAVVVAEAQMHILTSHCLLAIIAKMIKN